MSDQNDRVYAVKPGQNFDKCPLCGIHRYNVGYTDETCGPGFGGRGCFVDVASPSTPKQEQPQ